MKIIEPKVELWQQGNDSKAHVARCARVCYGRETGNNTNLLLLNVYYNIQWEECSCLRGIRLEDVTVELEKEAYEEMRHNI